MAHVDSFKKMNRIQIGAVILYGALFFFAPYLKPSPTDMIVDAITFGIGICLFLVNVISAIRFIVKEQENRRIFIHYGLRNIFSLVIPILPRCYPVFFFECTIKVREVVEAYFFCDTKYCIIGYKE